MFRYYVKCYSRSSAISRPKPEFEIWQLTDRVGEIDCHRRTPKVKRKFLFPFPTSILGNYYIFLQSLFGWRSVSFLTFIFDISIWIVSMCVFVCVWLYDSKWWATNIIMTKLASLLWTEFGNGRNVMKILLWRRSLCTRGILSRPGSRECEITYPIFFILPSSLIPKSEIMLKYFTNITLI